MATFELSEKKKYKNGRRPFKAVLYELQPPECVVDGVGTKYNKNGITFLEEYCEPQLGSIKDMSVTVEFLDEERTLISGHGMTGIEDGIPVFDNATTIGHFTEGYIDNIETSDGEKRVVIGKGYLDEMRYHAFIEQLEDDLSNDVPVEGSIEIFKSEGNDSIVYKNGYIPKGRIPTEFIHSGWTMVMNPADTTSTLLELNQKKEKKEENEEMEFNMDEIKSTIQTTISEMNEKSESYETQISELNSQLESKDVELAEKDTKISELNASIADMQKLLDDMKKDQETSWAEMRILEEEIAKAKIAEKLSALDKTLAEFSSEEQEVAKDDIDKLKSEISACKKKEELNSVDEKITAIKSEICMNIVANQKKAAAEAEAARIAEQNSHQEVEVEDIFSEMCEEETTDTEEDINIF